MRRVVTARLEEHGSSTLRESASSRACSSPEALLEPTGGREGAMATVLVVDDEPLLCFTTRQLLEGSGYTALTATSAAQALSLVERDPKGVEIVLLDLTMPGPPTGELIARLQRERAGIKVVLMSGYDEESARGRLGDTKVAAFLQKPFTLDQLNGTLERLLAR